MTTWTDFATDAPELAAAVRARFDATPHHVLATLRRDGRPRVSGTEVDLWRDQLSLGSMLDGVKAHDLQRDPRCAIHSNPGDGTLSGGDAKITARAVEATASDIAQYLDHAPETPQPFHLFLLDLTDVVLVSLDGDRMLMQTCRPGTPVRRIARPADGPAEILA